MALIIDCTEQPINGPPQAAMLVLRQEEAPYHQDRDRHHGKGPHRQRLHPAPGRVHDLEVRRRGPPLPKGSHAYLDSGYQGLQKDNPDAEVPYKRTKNRPLAPDERAYNMRSAAFRVRVEHTFAKLKAFRMLSARYRYPRPAYAAKFAHHRRHRQSRRRFLNQHPLTLVAAS